MSLTGQWYNQLGSRMELSVHNGEIKGKYHTAVGKTKTGFYQLVGQYDVKGKKNSHPIAFVVSWQHKNKNSGSITAWSGQYQTRNGKESIIATWLLTRATKPSNNWESTFTGSDVFTRELPILNKRAKGRVSRSVKSEA